MKIFIRKILIFISLIIIVQLSIFISFYFLLHNLSAKKLSFNNKKNTIILGDSHAQCSFNDSILNSAVNLGISGTPIFYSYLVLQKVDLLNSQLKKVVIVYSNNKIDSMSNALRYFGNKRGVYQLSEYFYLFHTKEFILFIQNSPLIFIKFYSIMFITRISKIVHLLYRYVSLDKMLFDGQKKLTYSIDQKKPEKISATENLSITPQQLIKANQIENEYFDSVITFSKAHDLQLFIIRTPLHRSYDRSNEKQFLNYIHSKKGFIFLDYADFPLPDSCFADPGHLNIYGADIFTAAFKERLDHLNY